MENQPINGAEKKIAEYAERIQRGEPKSSIYKDLPESFKSDIEKKLAEERRIEELRNELQAIQPTESTEAIKNPPINYIDVVIDNDYLEKNLMPNGGLRMAGGYAKWNGEVDLMRYSISDQLSPEQRQMVAEKIEKMHAAQEKTYAHESHHIRNRENGLTPHVAGENLREYLAFRVLDEMSAFTEGELYNQDISVENILQALNSSEQKIIDSYYGQPFSDEAQWYLSKHGTDSKVLSREINPEKYHQILRQYFTIKGQDILKILQETDKLPEFTKIIDALIIKLDHILLTVQK